MRICEPRPITPGGRIGCAPYLALLDTLSAVIAPLQALHQQAVEALAPTVHDILRSGSSDAPWIERTLDQLLDHACTPKGLTLFKALCRHYWQLDPQATASYVHAYRDMWDGEDLQATHVKLVEIEKDIATAKHKHKHNAFLIELGLSPLP